MDGGDHMGAGWAAAIMGGGGLMVGTAAWAAAIPRAAMLRAAAITLATAILWAAAIPRAAAGWLRPSAAIRSRL